MIASIELRRIRHRLRAIVALPQMARLCNASKPLPVEQWDAFGALECCLRNAL